MRIGIDAKWYFSGPPSTRTILRNLLPSIFHSFPEHEWVIFLDKEDRRLDFPFSGKNITIQYIWAGVNMFSNLFVLPYYTRKLGIDVILSQTFPSLSKKYTVVVVHDILFEKYPSFFSWKERLYFFPLKWCLRKADRIIATTKNVEADLLTYGYVNKNSVIDVVPLGVSKVFMPAAKIPFGLLAKVRDKYNLPQEYILYVGRLNLRKNLSGLLKAIRLLDNTNIPLVIAGCPDGKDANIKALLLAPELRHRVFFTGGVEDDELPAVYAMAKVFCFPSFAEGFGLPPLEAMASGVPVVTSNTTSLPEVCGDAACYIDPAKPSSIASSISHLLDNSFEYSAKRTKGLQQALKYNWDTTANLVMESITKAMNK